MERKQSFEFKIIFLVLAVGVVSPFAFGSTPQVSSLKTSSQQANTHQKQALQQANPLFQKSQSEAPSNTAIAESASTAVQHSNDRKKRSRIRRLISNLKPTSGRKDGSWKGGESKATIPSRLLFSYVSPLLDLASEKTLTEEDALEVAESRRMKHSVDSLAEIYERIRKKSQKKIEAQREMGADKVKRSQSVLLLKALLKQQRGMLLGTFVLRLLNTSVQAFPAILVSRLLRSIEAGNSIPASKAFTAAAMLLAVLSLKMVTENQFFHNVVSMSTKTRGSREGLIFDKYLRLPEGGSGVMAKQRSSEKKKALGSGGVLNLMQTDAAMIESAAMQIHTIWDGPLQVRLLLSDFSDGQSLFGHCLLIVLPATDRPLYIFVVQISWTKCSLWTCCPPYSHPRQ